MVEKPKHPICVFPVQSGHGDVHTFHVARTNGDSLTLSDFRWVFYQLTGHIMDDGELMVNSEWFAEEDRI